MSVISDLLAVLTVGREGNRKLDLLLAGQGKLMTDFDNLAGKVAGLDTKVDGLTTIATNASASLVNIRADIGRLKEIIAGGIGTGLDASQVAQLSALIDGVDTKAAAAVNALSVVAADAADVAAIVPEDGPPAEPATV